MADPSAFLSDLRARFGPDGCLDDAAARRVYARDASHLELGAPLAVLLPRHHDDVVAAVRLCADAGVPFTARGAGTGLSGGALPDDGSVVISLARLTAVAGADDPDRATVHAEPGVANAALNRLLAPRGGAFAPDPGSMEASTVGGNVAENAGGPHCLKVGTTVHHVRSLRWVDAAGTTWTSRGAGGDLTPLLVGSEGTLGIVTGAELVVSSREPGCATLLAYVGGLDVAARAVVDLLGSGLLPAALEVVDGAMLAVVEEAFGFGFRTDAAAAMIIEFTGGVADAAADAARATERLLAVGAEVRAARDEAERLDLWRCRKRAFGAVGRLSPNYVTMDVAVPLARLPEIVDAVAAAGRRHDVRIATALHAGDGNLHPGVMYDARDADSTRRAHAAADAIIDAALDLGGTVTGEHGVGIEKLDVLPRQLDPVALELMRGLKHALDPRGLCNPGKLLPDGPGLGATPPLPTAVRLDRDSMTVAAPTATSCAAVREAAAAIGFAVPGLDAFAGDAPLAAALAGDRTVRGSLLELWARTGDGRPFHTGRPVVKNVAGYDLARVAASLAAPGVVDLEAATFALRPAGSTAPPRDGDVCTETGAEPDRPLAAVRDVLSGGGRA